MSQNFNLRNVLKLIRHHGLSWFFLGAFGVFLPVLFFEVLLRVGIVPNPAFSRHQVDRTGESPSHKILILGDSFLEKHGHGSPLYFSLLEDLKGEGSIAVLNLARGGCGPLEYLMQAKVGLARLKPGNDLSDVQYRPAISSPWIIFLKSRIKQWYLYDFLERGRDVIRAMLLKGYVTQPPPLKKNPEPLNPYLTEVARRYPRYLVDNLLMDTEENERALERIRKVLTEIHRLCDKAGAKLSVVIFPQNLQVNGSLYSFYERLGFVMDRRLLTSEKAQKFMARFCVNERIACLDLLPYLRGLQNTGFYRANDDHLTAEGAAKAESVVFPFVRAQLHES